MAESNKTIAGSQTLATALMAATGQKLRKKTESSTASFMPEKLVGALSGSSALQVLTAKLMGRSKEEQIRIAKYGASDFVGKEGRRGDRKDAVQSRLLGEQESSTRTLVRIDSGVKKSNDYLSNILNVMNKQTRIDDIQQNFQEEQSVEQDKRFKELLEAMKGMRVFQKGPASKIDEKKEEESGSLGILGLLKDLAKFAPLLTSLGSMLTTASAAFALLAPIMPWLAAGKFKKDIEEDPYNEKWKNTPWAKVVQKQMETGEKSTVGKESQKTRQQATQEAAADTQTYIKTLAEDFNKAVAAGQPDDPGAQIPKNQRTAVMPLLSDDAKKELQRIIEKENVPPPTPTAPESTKPRRGTMRGAAQRIPPEPAAPAPTSAAPLPPAAEKLQQAATRVASGVEGQGTKIDEQYALNFFKNKGYSDEIAAAIVGNLKAESGLKTGAKGDLDKPGGASVGIAQWRKERLSGLKAFAAAIGTDYLDPDTQLEYVHRELQTSENKTLKQLQQKATSGADAAELSEVFGKGFERPAVDPKTGKIMGAAQRAKYAQALITSSQQGAVLAAASQAGVDAARQTQEPTPTVINAPITNVSGGNQGVGTPTPGVRNDDSTYNRMQVSALQGAIFG